MPCEAVVARTRSGRARLCQIYARSLPLASVSPSTRLSFALSEFDGQSAAVVFTSVKGAILATTGADLGTRGFAVLPLSFAPCREA